MTAPRIRDKYPAARGLEWFAAPDSLDHAYWNDKGWLDTKGCTYFFPHRASPITTVCARLIGGLVGALMT